jgi:hypothetical protein
LEALHRLVSTDLRHRADELKTVHPLVTKARWLFGPQFESSEFIFNRSVHRALETLFGEKIDREVFDNYRRRPDLICLDNSTISATATQKYDEDSGLFTIDHVLIVEVKRADVPLRREEMRQAQGYVEDLAASGVINGRPNIDAFVVGDVLDNTTKSTGMVKVGDPIFGKIRPCTFDQLIRTGNHRLFHLRQILQERYDDESSASVLGRVLDGPLHDALGERQVTIPTAIED